MLRGAAHAAANEHGTARVGFGDSGRRLVTRSGGAKRRRLSTDAGGHRREGARHPCLHLPLHRWTSCMADEHPSRRQTRRRRSATDSPCFPRFRRSITATGAATSRCRWHRSAPGAPRPRSSSRRPSSPRGPRASGRRRHGCVMASSDGTSTSQSLPDFQRRPPIRITPSPSRNAPATPWLRFSDRHGSPCDALEMSMLPKTPDPLAAAQVVRGPEGRSRSRTSMFKRVSAQPRRGDGARFPAGLVH